MENKLKEKKEYTYRNRAKIVSNIKPNAKYCVISLKLPIIEYLENDEYDNKKYTNINNDDNNIIKKNI